MPKNTASNPGRVKCFICHLRRARIMCTLQPASAAKLWNYRATDLAALTCPPPSSLHRSIAKAKSIAANTASASVLWEARISCRRLSYITGSKKAKSCQFTYKKGQNFGRQQMFKNTFKITWSVPGLCTSNKAYKHMEINAVKLLLSVCFRRYIRILEGIHIQQEKLEEKN